MYTPLLNEGGIVVCDNLDFHGLVKEKDLTSYSRNLRSMIKKIRLFRSFLENNPKSLVDNRIKAISNK